MIKQETAASAPGKIILFGEHAVVYGRPALAVPVTQVQATCRITAPSQAGVTIVAPNIDRRYRLADAAADDPPAAAVKLALARLNLPAPPAMTLTISSTIPIACGLGSGAAISTAIARAIGEHFERPFSPPEISDMVFEVEKIHHGTPSGIDNTVIAFARPIFFRRGQPVERLKTPVPLTFVIGDTGVKSQTYKVVGDLRRRRAAEPEKYEAYFDEIGAIAQRAKTAIEQGKVKIVGACMVENQDILREIGVSWPQLEVLVAAAVAAGAWGAKLSGAGWGGNMIALAPPAGAAAVVRALQTAGAVNTIVTRVG